MFGSGASKQKLQQITTALYELRWRRRHWSMNSTHPFSPFKKLNVPFISAENVKLPVDEFCAHFGHF